MGSLLVWGEGGADVPGGDSGVPGAGSDGPGGDAGVGRGDYIGELLSTEPLIEKLKLKWKENQ